MSRGSEHLPRRHRGTRNPTTHVRVSPATKALIDQLRNDLANEGRTTDEVLYVLVKKEIKSLADFRRMFARLSK